MQPIRISTKIGPKHQVTIPKEIFFGLNLAIGDYLEFQLKEHSVHVVPKKLIPKEDEWFHSPEWQAKEREADTAIQQGNVSRPFKSAAALLKHLNKTKRRGTA